MNSNNKISSEDVFRLVKGMTKYERQGFLEYLAQSSFSKRNKTNYIDYFKALSKSKAYQTVKTSSFFKSNTGLNEANKNLVNRIFEWWATRDHKDHWELTMIRKMVSFGFVPNAISFLQKEAEKAWEAGDIFQLRVLHLERDKICSHYNFSFSFADSVPSAEIILAEIGTVIKAEALYRSLKALTRKSTEQRLLMIKSFQTDAEQLEFSGLLPLSQVKVLKAKATWHILAREFSKGIFLYKQLQEIYFQNPTIFPIEEQIRQFYLNSLLLINEKRFHEAERAIFGLGSIEPQNETQRINLLTNWVFSAIFLSVYSGDVGLGKRAMRELPSIESSYSQARKIRVLHCVCTLHIYHGNWEKVLEVQDRISRTIKGVPEQFRASGYLQKVLSCYELGDFIQAKKELYRFEKLTQSFGLQYPNAVCTLFKSLMDSKSEGSVNTTLVFSNFVRQVEEIQGVISEEFLIEVLDLTVWAKGKINGQSIISQISKNNALAMVRISLVS